MGYQDNLVGFGGVTALGNGNYVVASPAWRAGSTAAVGAVTWANGSAAFAATVSAGNSMVGTTADDAIGSGGITVLGNGHYVIRSLNWDNSATAIVDVGAVTWVNGNTGLPITGLTGAVSQTNSLIGTRQSDRVGEGGVIVLGNGNYVVATPYWDNGAATLNVGAATWANGNTGLSGTVLPGNSLIGTTSNDRVGEAGVAALSSNGNYVVSSPSWDAANLGAATWASGNTGLIGVVSAANSLIGSTNADFVGYGGVTALSNGNYVIRSPIWNNGATAIADVAR